jgi:hypothetical protein
LIGNPKMPSYQDLLSSLMVTNWFSSETTWKDFLEEGKTRFQGTPRGDAPSDLRPVPERKTHGFVREAQLARCRLVAGRPRESSSLEKSFPALLAKKENRVGPITMAQEGLPGC